MLKYIDGSKTYAVAIVFLMAFTAYQFGYIDAESFEILAGALGFSGVVTLRHAISKLEKK